MRQTLLLTLGLSGLAAPAQACWLCGSPGLGQHHTNRSTPISGELLYTPSSSPPASASGLSVPAYNSLPGAYAKIFLDFDGDVTNNWQGYTPGTTPAYDTDGDASSFSTTELNNITEIWKRVSEKYSPFNVNVTTVDPGNDNDRETVRVVIGGTGAWSGLLAGGLAYPGGFYNGLPNTVFVFPKNLANGVPKYTAEASAHEAGHAFGLDHQADWTTSPMKPYSEGDGVNKAPIMGKSYHTTRGLWWNGTSASGSSIIQNDLAIISSLNNGFGYRADDVGNSIPSGKTITLDSNGQISAAGVIENISDRDYFNFTTLGGSYSFSINNAEFGGMLDVSAWLYDGSGSLINSAGTTAVLSEMLSGFFGPGSYSLAIGSAGNYGDIGQYRISGGVTLVLVPEPASGWLVIASTMLLHRRKRTMVGV